MYRNILGMTEAQWNDAVTNAGRHVLTKAVFNGDTTLYGDGTDGAVVSIKFDEQMENSNGLSMGGTIASQCKVEIRQPSTPISLVNSTFVPYVGLKDSANREGYVPFGEFFATSADSNSNGGVVSVVGYDRFCKLEVPYEPTVSFPTTTTAIMADLAANRFTFSGTITDRPINEFRVGTVKDWIGWLAGLEGKNARFNRDGQLEFVYYDITQYDYTVDRENQYMAGVNTKTADNVTINAITSGTEENPIVSGNGRSITFSNPYMTQEILDDIRNTEIVDSLTEVSGELITVDAIEAPAKSVEVNIEPIQNLNGYDHPWVGGAGKNLLKFTATTKTINGVTFTVNADGTVTANGTATANAYLYLLGYSSTRWSTGSRELILNGCPSNGSATTYQMLCRDDSNNWTTDRGSGGTISASATYVNNLSIAVYNGYTCSNLVFKPMICLATESDATYAPYENICPITGKTGTKVFRTGRNIVPNNMTNGTNNGITYTKNADGSVHIQGTATATSSRTLCAVPNGDLSVVDGVKYKFYNNGSSSSTYRVRFSSIIKETGATANWNDYTQVNGFTIDESVYDYRNFQIYVVSGQTVDKIIYPMLEVADIATGEYEPYKGTQYPITFGREVYGGTLDIVSGVLTVTQGYYELPSTLDWSTSSVLVGRYYIKNATLNIGAKRFGRLICNQAKGVQVSTTVLGECYLDTNGQFAVNTSYSTVADFKQSIAGNPIAIAYELATPQTYQLTPTQVELLKGTNNIWADGNSTLNITYLATPRANMSFRPMELQWRGNPCVQCGDRIFVETETNSLTALVMAHTLSIEGGMNDVIKCFGSSDAEVALDKSPMEKKISTAYNALQSAIQDATALLTGTRGGIFEITKENGINTGWLIKESASPNYMGNVIVANYNGIGFSTDGGATYGTAITTDGHINGQYITAHSVDVEALSVGNTSDPFSNYVYIGRRRPNDDNTDMVIRIGVASQSMVQEMRGNRTSIYKTEDVQAYVNGSLTDAELDARALMYYSDTDYVLLNLGSFRIGGMLMQAQANGGVKFIKAE